MKDKIAPIAVSPVIGGGIKTTPTEPTPCELRDSLKQIVNKWDSLSHSLGSQLRGIKGPHADLMKTQVNAATLHQYSEIVSRAVDSLHETVRRMQQSAQG